MTYKELAKIYHMDSSSSRESNLNAEYQHRLNTPFTYVIDVDTNVGKLFITSPGELLVLLEKILCMERRLSKEMNRLPSIAQAALIRSLILDEVVSTNAIEDIHSTRQQIEEALEAWSGDIVAFRRFKELALLYLGLSEGAPQLPQTPQDIRALYDLVMDGELSEKQLPDGELFRAHGVEVTQGGIKVIHRGVQPEVKIVDCLQDMITLTKRSDMPQMLSAIASHYLFEYIHPFYDGNGRTGRYLLALYLSEPLSTPTVLSLSRTIAENKGAYYAAFSSAENPLNKGELTFFVLQMLELISIAQNDTFGRIQGSNQRFENAKGTCSVLFEAHNLSKCEREIIFALVQFELFGSGISLTWDDLARFIGLEKQTVRKHAANLEAKQLICKVKKRPLRFALTDVARESIGIALV